MCVCALFKWCSAIWCWANKHTPGANRMRKSRGASPNCCMRRILQECFSCKSQFSGWSHFYCMRLHFAMGLFIYISGRLLEFQKTFRPEEQRSEFDHKLGCMVFCPGVWVFLHWQVNLFSSLVLPAAAPPSKGTQRKRLFKSSFLGLFSRLSKENLFLAFSIPIRLFFQWKHCERVRLSFRSSF